MNNIMDNQSGLQCFWSNLKEHPKCIHGPTLLFGKLINNEWQKFYLCAACRKRQLCPFYLDHRQSLTNQQESKWTEKTKQYVSTFHRQKLFIELHKILALNPAKRCYCHTCERLFAVEDKPKHEKHDFIEGLTDEQISHPTELIKPAIDCKKEAQYLFSKKSTADIVNFLKQFGAQQVLCIGAPRIHEYITSEMGSSMSSLLLDLDGRFHNFYGSLEFCWYNLFNHHFFYNDSKIIFKDFMTQNNGKNLYIVCDPPFGGRVEAIAQTLKTIADSYKKWNQVEDEPKVLFIFPYFMKSIMKHKSSPPGVTGGLKDYEMVEYRVEYDNHPLFVKNVITTKLGSPVRIFTNIPLNLFELSDIDYKFCKKCNRWVTLANKHCQKCKDCTSKDGRSYKHCDTCNRCVKDFWIHCSKCNRCNIVEHKCGNVPVIYGFCNKCNQPGHTESNCVDISTSKKRKSFVVNEDESEVMQNKKRKLDKKDKEENKKGDNNCEMTAVKKEKKKKQKVQHLTNKVKDSSEINGEMINSDKRKKKKQKNEILQSKAKNFVKKNEEDMEIEEKKKKKLKDQISKNGKTNSSQQNKVGKKKKKKTNKGSDGKKLSPIKKVTDNLENGQTVQNKMKKENKKVNIQRIDRDTKLPGQTKNISKKKNKVNTVKRKNVSQIN